MRVLVVGSAGREHALCWALAASGAVDELFAAPGNAGIAELAGVEAIGPGDLPGLVALAERLIVDLVVVGPEAPLVAGLVDALRGRGIPAFGPSSDGARIEGSKVWAKRLCERHGIPAARSREFDRLGAALAYLEELEPPYVVKADGLAAGKGVTVADDRRTAERALEDCLVAGVFGEAGRRVLVEECLEGPEVSALALCDGRTIVPLALAQDFKRAHDGDAGPNTGGMGAYSPVPIVDGATRGRIEREILRPALRALAVEGIDYRGVLYAGLMLTAEGPKVLEFNCRFGDPEAQVVIPRLAADLAPVLSACAEGRLAEHALAWRAESCVGVVLASGGYPGPVEIGKPITGLDEAARVEGVTVFHSGTAVREGTVVTTGGRVLTVTGLGSDVDEARRRAYEACARISFEGAWHRRDIAAKVAEGVR